VPDPALDVVAEDAEEEHVAGYVAQARVGELARQKAQDASAGGYLRRDGGEGEGPRVVRAEALEKDENQDIDSDENPGNRRRASPAAVVVANWKHLSNLLAMNIVQNKG
jgi:hypothetical protein